jgi:hypothetical protein
MPFINLSLKRFPIKFTVLPRLILDTLKITAMKKYYVNNQGQSNGDHEVHHEHCTYLPQNKTYLGEFIDCRPAIKAAERHYRQVNGCKLCSSECHTQ